MPVSKRLTLKSTLKFKIIMTIVIVIAFFGALATVTVYKYSKDILIENATGNLRFFAKEMSIEVKQIMQRGAQLTQTMATQDFIVQYLKDKTPTFQDETVVHDLRLFNIADAYSVISLMNLEGTILVSTDPTFVGQNYNFREYFTAAISGQQYMDVFWGVTSHQLGYYFSSPVRDENNNIIGVAVAKMKPEFVNKNIDFSRYNNYFHLMVVDKTGLVLFSDKDDRVLKSLGNFSAEKQQFIESTRRFDGLDIQPLQYDILQKDIDSITENVTWYNFFDKIDNAKEVFGMVKVEGYPLILIVEEMANRYFNPAYYLAFLLSIFVAMSTICTIITLMYLIPRYLNPLKKLQDAANKIAEGDFSARVQFTSVESMELNNLSASFNKMLDVIEESRTSVESKVVEQTKQLTSGKDALEKQQKAILNILEDVEGEKNKVEQTMIDLEKFKLAVDSASDHIIITDSDGIVIYANAAMERVTGYSIDEAVGRKAGVLWGRLMEREYYKKMWDKILIDKKVFIGEIKNRRKNGDEYYAFLTISPVLNNQGNVIFLVGIERDITKEKQIDKSKTEFVSLASHQLRTPLSAINWYTEMLLAGDTGKLNKEQTQYLGEVYRGNQRMVTLVNALLNVSRIELGTFIVEPEMASIGKLTDQVLEELKPGIIKKKLKIKKEHVNEYPPINLDIKLMTIVMQNLLSNAVKYSKEGGEILVAVAKKRGGVEITIVDKGLGIPKDQYDKIFTKLFRADNVAKTDTEGTGLGLYMVKSIMNAVGGKITFESVENKGTTFFIFLPTSGMKKKEGTKHLI